MAKKKVEELTIEEKLNNALIPVDKQPYEIPKNWCWVNWSSAGNLIAGNGFPNKYQGFKDYEIPFYKVGSLKLSDRQGYIFDDTNTINNDIFKILKCSLIPINSILFAKIGEAIKLNRRSINNKPCCIDNNMMAFIPKCCLFKYAYYWTTTIDLYKYAKATVVPALRKIELDIIPFPLPPLEEQERIVNKLDNYISKLDEAKEKLEKVVDTYEFRKSVILHRAFTGELTKKWRKENNTFFDSWNKNKLSDLCIINPPKNIKNISENTIVSLIPMSCVSEDGYVIEYLTKEIKDVQKGLTNFIEGDVVFAKITPCMENGKSAIIGKLANDIGFGTTEFYVFRCNDKLYNKYLHYIFRDKVFRTNAKYYMRGAVGQQRLPKSYLENYILNLPPLEEQKEIVKILDSILSKEKQVKEIAEKEIERLKDLKKNLLTRAFGGVLGTNNPNEENSIELLKSVL